MQRAGLTIRALSAAGAALLLCSAPSRAQEKQTGAQEIEAILQQFSADQWESRAKAFYRLISLGEGDGSYIAGAVKTVLEKYPNQADQIKLALMRLLERENARMEELNLRYQKTGQTIGQDYDTDYYANVIASVATLKDIRSMNALLGAITTGGMATRTLASFAPQSLEPTLRKVEDSNPLVRQAAVLVLNEMLTPGNYKRVSDPGHREKIKRALVSAAKDGDSGVRKVAVLALADLGDTDVIPLIQVIARTDPASYPRAGRDYYYVREAATKALSRLRSKEKSKN